MAGAFSSGVGSARFARHHLADFDLHRRSDADGCGCWRDCLGYHPKQLGGLGGNHP